jgi:dephospho-CoA kinase
MKHVEKPKRLVVGLTGSIATGKTTMACFFEKLGAKVICCDELAHRALEKKTPTYNAIIRVFGEDVVDTQGRINRKTLAKIIFTDQRKRRKLENIIHPFVFKELKKALQKKTGVIMVDIPLLFETGFEKYLDETLVVSCTRKEQLRRLIKRDGLSRVQAVARIQSQMPLSAKKKLASWVIDNTHLAQALRRAQELWNEINELATRKRGGR